MNRQDQLMHIEFQQYVINFPSGLCILSDVDANSSRMITSTLTTKVPSKENFPTSQIPGQKSPGELWTCERFWCWVLLGTLLPKCHLTFEGRAPPQIPYGAVIFHCRSGGGSLNQCDKDWFRLSSSNLPESQIGEQQMVFRRPDGQFHEQRNF